MSKLVTVIVNGKDVAVKAGSNILAALRARKPQVFVPTLCYHPEFEARGVCRMCLVDIEGWRKPAPSCYTKVEEGMKITTDSEELKNFRRADLALTLSRHPNECIRCEVSGNCKLQDLVQEYELEDRWPKSDRGDISVDPNKFSPGLNTYSDTNTTQALHSQHRLEDHTSPSISLDIRKCIDCGLCVGACESMGPGVLGFVERGFGMVPTTLFDKPLKDIKCISCGQCTLRCPVGAVTERPDWHRVLDILDSGRHATIVQTSPSSRVAIGEEFGFEPGTITTGKMINALRALGFDYVFDTCFAADVLVLEEAAELLERLRNGGPVPMFTSCCPAWVNYLELNRPDLLKHLSNTKSPQQIHGCLSKHGAFAETLPESVRPFVVSIMPCTAKKDEAVRPGLRGDVDAVITTRELARMLRHRKIPFGALSDDGVYDKSLGESSGAGVIFGASGGVLESILRTITHLLGQQESPVEFGSVRGVEGGIKEASVVGIGTVAAISPMRSAIELLKTDEWKKYLMIEVMACKGGCIGGGGEPKSEDPDVLKKRAKGIYQIDTSAYATKRRSYENEEVKILYNKFLGHPGSERSKTMLRTTFAERHSPREYLAMFLDAVDSRDGERAASLFDQDGIWDTSSPIGCLKGPAQIKQLINAGKLPEGRHVLLDPAQGMLVRGPNAKLSTFEVEISHETHSIKRLKRTDASSNPDAI